MTWGDLKEKFDTLPLSTKIVAQVWIDDIDDDNWDGSFDGAFYDETEETLYLVKHEEEDTLPGKV
jgi:hypothetical protein